MDELSANIEKRYRPPVWFHGEFRCSKTLRGKGRPSMRERFSGSIIAVAIAVAAVNFFIITGALLRCHSSNTIRLGPSRCRMGGYWDRWAAFASMRATTCSS